MQGRLMPDMPDAEYRAHPAIAQSSIKRILPEFGGNPDEYRRSFEVHEDTTAMAFGRALHVRVLQPELWGAQYVRGPDDRRGNKWASAVEAAELRGAECLTSGDYDAIEDMAARVYEHPTAALALEKCGLREASFFATLRHGEDATECKCRMDAVDLDNHMILDLKTTDTADPVQWQRKTLDYGYHVQAAYYCDIYATTGHVPQFIALCVEKPPRRGVSVVLYPPEWIEVGRVLYRSGLDALKKAQRADDWSAYGWQIHTLGMDGWVRRKFGI